MENNQYYEMFAKVQSGIISEEVWKEYCFNMLDEVLEQNKDVFIRLKNRY
jgi:hypothetical protein